LGRNIPIARKRGIEANIFKIELFGGSRKGRLGGYRGLGTNSTTQREQLVKFKGGGAGKKKPNATRQELK